MWGETYFVLTHRFLCIFACVGMAMIKTGNAYVCMQALSPPRAPRERSPDKDVLLLPPFHPSTFTLMTDKPTPALYPHSLPTPTPMPLPRLRSVKMEQRKLNDQANTLVDLAKVRRLWFFKGPQLAASHCIDVGGICTPGVCFKMFRRWCFNVCLQCQTPTPLSTHEVKAVCLVLGDRALDSHVNNR